MRRTLVLVVAITACGRDASTTFDPSRGAGIFESIALPEAPPGLSDLALDPKGVPWSIAERDRFLVEITLVDATHATTKRHPIIGIPDGVDAESLVWLGPDKLAIGLEWQDEGKAAIAIAARVGDDGFLVGSIDKFSKDDVGLALKKNHGAEGICGSDGDLLVAIEETGELPGGGRYAPIVRITDELLPAKSIYRLHLGTQTGKISALACTITAGAPTHVLAIERHYGVSRIVTFDVPSTPAETPLEETLVVDLAPVLKDSLNLEGIVKLPDGRMLAISDNQSKSVTGPGYVLVFPAR